MVAALEACRDYPACVVQLFGDRSAEAGEQIRTARRRIGLAAVNAEESFGRLLAEYDGRPGDLSPLMTFLTYVRRLSVSTAALALARHSSNASSAMLAPFRERAVAVLDDLAVAVREHRRPLPLPILVEGTELERDAAPQLRARVDRVARQLRQLHDAVDEWTERPDHSP